MQIRVCDRCAVSVLEVPAREGLHSILVPHTLPASAPVAENAAINLAIGVQAPADLCPTCRLSAMAEYVAQEIWATKSVDLMKAFGARVLEILQGLG